MVRSILGRGPFFRVAATVIGAVCAVGMTATLTSAAGAAGAANASEQTLHIAYMSFSVQNSYDAPMLAAAQKQAKASHAVLTVFNAATTPTKQYNELQTVISSHEYQGIITQPIESTNLISLVREAIADHIAVANMDQELGPKLTTAAPQVKGLAANVVFVPTKIGGKLGVLVSEACAKFNPCNIGYMWDIKDSSLDSAIHGAFMKQIQRHKNIKIVATGQSYFTPSKGEVAAEDMLTAHPTLNLIVGSDQGMEGSTIAIADAGRTGKVILVGYGASEAAVKGVESGKWYASVAQLPASEGQLAVKYLAESIRTHKKFGGIDPVTKVAHNGIMTKANAASFHAQWPG
ncbi:MAG: sugar ABC transporter substrate-binding protein [Acidimicrobiales bacterium]